MACKRGSTSKKSSNKSGKLKRSTRSKENTKRSSGSKKTCGKTNKRLTRDRVSKKTSKKTKSKAVKSKATQPKKAKKSVKKPVVKKTKKESRPTKVRSPATPKRSTSKSKKINLKKILSSNPNLRRYLIDVGGEPALAVVQALRDESCTEDTIIKRSKAGKSDVRSTLNKLHGIGLVKYTRTKDPDTGLYSYTWNLRLDKLLLLHEQTQNMTERTDTDTPIERYVCKACGVEQRYTFEEAYDLRFKCPFCGSILDLDEEED